MLGGFVYVLESLSNGRYYIGSSKNPDDRLLRHNRGSVQATRNKGPWIIKFKQYYENVADARRMELRLKKFKNKDIIERIILDGVIKASKL
jgi:putative endonuclease